MTLVLRGESRVAAGRSTAGQRPAARKSKLDPSYKPMVDRLLGEGVWNAQVILREIQAAGYRGKRSILRNYTQTAAADGAGDRAVRNRAGPPAAE